MGLSDIIAEFIDELLISADGEAELKRSELAGRFNVVPSQINYVIATRFSPERGYVVESRRGGGGYIRIRRVIADGQMLIMHTVNALGDEIDMRTAAALIANLEATGAANELTARLMLQAVSPHALREAPPGLRNILRSSILKQMLMQILD